jgi:arylsulfatase A
LTLPLSVANAAERVHKPNVVLILVDDLGERCLSGFGGTIPTPNLDRLAREGMVFDNAHAAPMCAATRDEMFTGLSRAGRGRPDASVPFFTNDLQKLGYTTGMAGKWFVGSVFDPPLRGFDESLITVNGYRHWAPDVMAFGSGGLFKELNQPKVTGRLNEWEIPREGDGPHRATRLSGRHADDVCVEFLQDFLERHKNGPFFAYYSTKLVHVPQAPTPDADQETIQIYQKAFEQANDRDLTGVDAYAREEAARRKITIDSKRFRNDGIRYLDKMVGQLIEALDRLGIRDETLVLFTSDNGNSPLDPLPEGVQPLPGRKGDSREGGTRVPLIANWLGQITPGSHCGDLVHVQDFLPTLVELAGGTVPEGRVCDGRSFAPQLFGKRGSPREWFIGTGAHPSVWLDRVAQELGKRDLYPDRLVWVHGLRYKLYNDGRFYDLQEDLAEAQRIPPGSGSAEAEAIRTKFQAVLDAHRGE